MRDPFVIKLRVATTDDSDFLRRLRNDEETRKWSRQNHEISEEDHDSWFRETTDRVFIAEKGSDRVGTVRLVRHPHELELGLVVAPEFRGQGYAAQMIEAAAKEAWYPVVAYVRSDNEKSLKAFDRAGFRRDDTYVRFTKTSDES